MTTRPARGHTPRQPQQIVNAILDRLAAGETWHLSDYALDRNLVLRNLVFAALATAQRA